MSKYNLDDIDFEASMIQTCSACGQKWQRRCLDIKVGELTFCEDCVDVETIVCQYCGMRMLNKDNQGDHYSSRCMRCSIRLGLVDMEAIKEANEEEQHLLEMKEYYSSIHYDHPWDFADPSIFSHNK